MDVAGIVRKAADKTGFSRERTNEDRLPTDSANITVLPFFGDLRSLFVLSSLLLNRFRTEDRGSKYFILCSWPGFSYLFPYVDEYWGLADEADFKKMYTQASQFANKSELTSNYYRNLNNYFFEDVIPEDFSLSYYHHGITDCFWKKYKHVKRSLPAVPSAALLDKDFHRGLLSRGGFKLFVYPSTHLTCWQMQEIVQRPVTKEFWVFLLKRLLSEQIMPVVYRGTLTHDVSDVFTDKCLYITDKDQVLVAMRATGCVLDVFSGISRLALAARCPFLAIDERLRYATLREYEVDDLCCPGLPKQYIFSFPTIIDGGNPETWDFNIVNSIIARLSSFFPSLDRDNWPSTGESTEMVLYESVRKKKHKRMGTKVTKGSEILMSNAVRVRVELRQWHDDRETAFKKMFTAFKRACTDAGVQHAYKQHETYESKSRKRRRKQRESEIQRLKAKLRENFNPMNFDKK